MTGTGNMWDAGITGQPFSGEGHVFAQVGWLDDNGAVYGLRLPDTLLRGGGPIRAVYIGLGRHDVDPADEE